MISANHYVTEVIIKGVTNTLFTTHHPTDISRRKVTVNNNGFVFESASFIGSSTDISTDNARVIPIKIFGIKL